MKYLTYIVMVLFFNAITACQKDSRSSNQFTLKGEIKGLDGNLYFTYKENEKTKKDTIFVKDGKINFTGSISELTLINASYDSKAKNNNLYKRPASGGYYPVKSMHLMFYAFPGAEITVHGEATDFMDAYPSGDKFNNSLAEINKIAYPYYNNSVNLLVQRSFEKDSNKIIELRQQARKISNEGKQKRLEYIQSHPESLAALWNLDDMLKRKEIEDSTAINIFETMSNDLSEFDIYKSLQVRVSGIHDTKEGKQLPDIKTKATLDGREFDIASLKGKYILIDFWGVWCGPCVREMPRLKVFHKKHQDKLAIVGINYGDSKEKAQQFLDDNDYGWQQLFSSKENNEDNFIDRFNVKTFPTKLIINPEGEIVKRYVGSGEEAFILLGELLN